MTELEKQLETADACRFTRSSLTRTIEYLEKNTEISQYKKDLEVELFNKLIAYFDEKLIGEIYGREKNVYKSDN